MKSTLVIGAVSCALLLSCSKESPEEINDSGNNTSTAVVVKDTNQLSISNFNAVDRTTVNTTLEVNSPDSSSYIINHKDQDVFSIQVVYDTLRDSQNRRINYKGIFYKMPNSGLRVGKHCPDSIYAFGFGELLNYSSLCDQSYSTSDYYRGHQTNQRCALAYDISEPGANPHILLRSWKPASDNNGMGEGYLGFRFLDGKAVKYGWVHLNVLGIGKVVVVEYAFQK